MTAKKKIFIYSIVSTIVLLLICVCILVLVKNKNFEKEYAFNLSMPSKNFYEDCFSCSLEKILSFRNFKTYEITNVQEKDEILYSKIKLSVRNIVKNKDPKNGIHVKFNLKTKYEDVIRILDICETEKAPTYILKDYDIWIMAGKNTELIKKCPLKIPKR
jgi:hypothetical protein